MDAYYSDVFKKAGDIVGDGNGQVCFLTGIFLLKSVPTVMDQCGFEQDRQEQFSYDVYWGGWPVYVVWELYCRGVMPSCGGTVLMRQGDSCRCRRFHYFLHRWEIGKFKFSFS